MVAVSPVVIIGGICYLIALGFATGFSFARDMLYDIID
jgi:hypothetical protein